MTVGNGWFDAPVRRTGILRGLMSCRHFWISALILSLLPSLACGRYRARHELQRNEYFAEILRRTGQRSIGEDRFFEDNLLGNPYPEVRQWCAVALGRISSKRALPLLYQALHKADAAVRAASAFSIGIIEDRKTLRQRNQLPDPAAAREVASLLDDHSIAVRMRATEALGKIGSRAEAVEIVERLQRFSYGGSPVERAYLGFAITALARLGDPVARPVLAGLANSTDKEIRERATQALSLLSKADADPANSMSSPSPSQDPNGSRIPGESQEKRRGALAVTEEVSRALASSRKNSTVAIVETTRGTLEIELFREDAPLTAAGFVLAARRGDFSGFPFQHALASQRIEGEMTASQTGFGILPRGEINMRPFERGSLGISFAGAIDQTGRLFIALAAQPYLDGQDTCFGRVISGMQVADRIAPGDKILRITIRDTIGTLDYVRY